MFKMFTILIPIILILFWEILIQQTLGRMQSGFLRSAISALTGLLFSALLGWLIIKMLKKNKIPRPLIGNAKSFWVGLCFGLAVSGLSGILFQLHLGQPPHFAEFFSNYLNRLLVSFTPAASEELAFRFNLVQIISYLYSPVAALVAGSLPFGLLHLLGRFFGQDVGLMQVLGVSLAGLLLSLLYLRYGLLAAIACHWVWNSFSLQWVEAYGMDLKNGAVQLESSWSTITVLTVFIVFIFRMIGVGRLQMKKNTEI